MKNPFQRLKDQAALRGSSPAKAIMAPLIIEAKGGILGDLSRKQRRLN